MTTKRTLAAGALAFLVSQVLAVAIHGFLLAPDYAPYYGTLLRPMDGEGSWQMLLLPLSHIAFVSGLVFIYNRLALHGTRAIRGFKLGALGWLLGQVPLFLLWYAEQPWPGSLVLKQLTLEFVSSLAIGLAIASVARPMTAATPSVVAGRA